MISTGTFKRTSDLKEGSTQGKASQKLDKGLIISAAGTLDLGLLENLFTC